jgi:hypothetical protein
MKRVDAVILVDSVLAQACSIDDYVDMEPTKREKLVRSIMQKYALKK